METHTDQHLHPPSSSYKPSDPHTPPPPPLLDLYTIPTHSCWFSWDSIHDTERHELSSFFDGSSFTRTPKIYKEYRDFIISKFREDPTRRLTFTELRKSLVGDVCVLRRVFDFLDKWGLINFNTPPPPVDPTAVEGEDVRVKVEEGAPVGVRVVVAPGSLKPLVVPGSVGGGVGSGGGEVKVRPALASYKDVFGGKDGRVVKCGRCKEKCDSKYYECTKEKFVLCLKCFEKGAFGENKGKDDFKLSDSAEDSAHIGAVWTEAETLLLLESVLKHGDDWELVAQSVQTKTKHECISRLIELPFGELMLGSREKFSSRGTVDEGNAGKDKNSSGDAGQNHNVSSASAPRQQASSGAVRESSPVNATKLQEPFGDTSQGHKASNGAGQEQKSSNDVGQEHKASSEAVPKDGVPSGGDAEQMVSIDAVDEQKASEEPQEKMVMMENHNQENNHHNQLDVTEMDNNTEIQNLEPPLKKSRIDISDPSRSLMEQVALISTMVGPRITAAAANAAVTVLSDGNPLVRDIFYIEEPDSTDEQRSGNLDTELERAFHSEDTEMKDASHALELDKISSARESIPLALQMRAAVGTALGAAAAHARLLADQEEREIEQLMAFIIETQLKKLDYKVQLFEDLELLMKKEHVLLEESKDSIIGQRMDVLQRIIGAGIS